MHTQTRTLLLAPWLVLGAMLNIACNEGDDTSMRSVDVDLDAFGIASVEVDQTGVYRLLDEDANEIGAVRGSIATDAVSLEIDLSGEHGELAWAPSDLAVSCGGDESIVDGAMNFAACEDALTVSTLIAEAEGATAPMGKMQPADDGFRLAPGGGGCYTVTGWAFNGWNPCGVCFGSIGGYGGSYSGGSCSVGWTYATCSETYCF
jgi:hypothetical protein